MRDASSLSCSLAAAGDMAADAARTRSAGLRLTSAWACQGSAWRCAARTLHCTKLRQQGEAPELERCSAAAGARGVLCSGESACLEASWCCARVRSMRSCSVLRHAGWRPVQCPQYIAPRRAGWCSTTSALTGARGARRRAWHGRLERRGCRSTPRRMGAAEAARQAAGIAAAKSARPLLCFRPRFTTTFGLS